MSQRNPVIIPNPTPRGGIRCRSCGSGEYTGRIIGGVANMQCKSCGNQWVGGIPQEPQDPRQPIPPTAPKPGDITYSAERSRDGEVIKVVEERSRQDTTQAFRKGAPIPEEEGY